jgi:hypothetical protein
MTELELLEAEPTAVPTDSEWIAGISPDQPLCEVADRVLDNAVCHALPLAAERSDEDIEHVHQPHSGQQALEVLRVFAGLMRLAMIVLKKAQPENQDGRSHEMATDNSRAIEDDITRRTVARNAYRAKIESLLDESSDERLADVWQWVYHFPIELPDRREIIEDLADLAEALKPSLDGMQADRLCRLIENYAACEFITLTYQFPIPPLPHRSGEQGRGRGPIRAEAECRDEQPVLV